MFYITESFYEFFCNYLSSKILTGLGISYIGIVGTVLLCSRPKSKEESIDYKSFIEKLNWNRIMLVSIKGEHDIISNTIMDNKEELEKARKQFEFRADMRFAEIQDLRNRINQIENNIYDTEDEE